MLLKYNNVLLKINMQIFSNSIDPSDSILHDGKLSTVQKQQWAESDNESGRSRRCNAYL